MDEALLVEAWGGEVDEEGSLEPGGFQVIKHLGGFDIGECLDRLDLDDDRAVADEIGATGSAKSDSFREPARTTLSGKGCSAG